MHPAFMKRQWSKFLENAHVEAQRSLPLSERFFRVWQLLSGFDDRIHQFDKKIAPFERDENGDPISYFRIKDYKAILDLVEKMNKYIQVQGQNVNPHNVRSYANKIIGQLEWYVDFLERERRNKHPKFDVIINDLTHAKDKVYKLLDF